MIRRHMGSALHFSSSPRYAGMILIAVRNEKVLSAFSPLCGDDP